MEELVFPAGDEPDYIPISMLNELEYCERCFWLYYVLGAEEVNAPLLEGRLLHRRANTPGVERDGDTLIHRRVYVWSDRLRVSGFADFVEERAGELVPVEFKHGRMGRWLNDHIQVCAQAMCLEERTGEKVDYGQIFYWGSRRRETVKITDELRAKTEAAIRRAFEILASGEIPQPLKRRAKCRDCSLEGICMPREVLRLLEMDEGSG